MSHDLSKVGGKFSTTQPEREVDCITTLGTTKAGRIFAYVDLAIRPHDQVDKTRHRVGDIILAFNDNRLSVHRINSDSRIEPVGINCEYK